MPAAPTIRPQFGSRPWIAALTSELETTARATARASASSVRARHVAGQERRGALAVGRLLARQVAGDRLDRAAERGRPPPSPRRPARCPAAPLARRMTVSFVLVSPSIESWFQVRAAAGRSSPLSVAGSIVASVSRTLKHRRHPRMDHPDALGHARDADRDRTAVGGGQLDRRRDDLRPRVRRPQGDRGRLEPGVAGGQAAGHDPVDPRQHQVEREARPDDAGRHRERRRWRRADRGGQPGQDRSLVGFAGGARRGVGAAGRGDDAGRPSPSGPRPRAPVAARFARLRRTGAAAIVFGVKTAAAAAGIRPSGPGASR